MKARSILLEEAFEAGALFSILIMHSLFPDGYMQTVGVVWQYGSMRPRAFVFFFFSLQPIRLATKAYREANPVFYTASIKTTSVCQVASGGWAHGSFQQPAQSELRSHHCRLSFGEVQNGNTLFSLMTVWRYMHRPRSAGGENEVKTIVLCPDLLCRGEQTGR